MELKTYLAILQKHWRFVVAGTLVTALLALLLSFFIPDRYSAEARLRVSTPLGGSLSDTYYQTGFADRLMNTYVQIATSQAMMNSLKQKVGLAALPDISLKIIPNSEIIQIVVEGSDPSTVARTANALAELLITSQSQPAQGSPAAGEIEVLKQQRDDLLASWTQAQKDNDELAQDYAQTSAKIAVLEKKIAVDEALLQNRESRSLDTSKVEEELTGFYQQYQDLLTESSKAEQQIATIRQTIENDQTTYSNLLLQYNSALVASARQAIDRNVMIISPAIEPARSGGHSPAFVMGLGALCGMIAGVFLAFLRESMAAQRGVGYSYG